MAFHDGWEVRFLFFVLLLALVSSSLGTLKNYRKCVLVSILETYSNKKGFGAVGWN